jgi:predicted nucleotidyltransferase
MNIQAAFAERVKKIVQEDPSVTGLAVAGSWISNEMDEFSDLDLVLVTKYKIAGNKDKMLETARRFGDLVSGFTGEHVGEPRVLICLYDNPLLHVDIKFLTPDEFKDRIENPVILFEREGQLSKIIHSTTASWPQPDFQWIEDRFWTWIHYAALKIGRGELMEAYDFLSFLRMTVLSPLLQVKNNRNARGLRKVETELSASDLENLKITIAQYNRASILKALDNTISIYKNLRRKLYDDKIILQSRAEKLSTTYLKEIAMRDL